ncbi:MAG: hypothetical protein AB7H93_16660 [Vicinamibacterales bacterium]
MIAGAAALLQQRLAAEVRARRWGEVARWVLGGASVGLMAGIGAARFAGAGTAMRLVVALLPVLAAAAFGGRRAAARWSPAAAAAALERGQPADNLVVTADALARVPDHPWLPVVAAAAWSRIEARTPTSARGAWLRLAVSGGLALAGAVVPIPPRGTTDVSGPGGSVEAPLGIAAVSVIVTPPAYLGRAPAAHDDPTGLEVLAGSQVALRVTTAAPRVALSRDGAPPIVAATSDGVATAELPAAFEGAWLVAAAGESRLVRLRRRDDAPPRVRIVEPGRDRRQPRPVANLPVRLEAGDDLGLAALSLRVTVVSGGGESFTFADRELSVRVTERTDTAWQAETVLPLATLDLHDGDVVVYRGVAADGRPDAPPVESDAFIVEVGAPRAASDAGGGGEDVDPDERQAISQQMVIVKTERLHARRGQLPPEERLAESQGLAIEQRMVRAEFVFMMGGEVQDEVEEAAHAHDLVEGRLENEGQAALVGATRAMSRAEARLTGGDTAGALVAEREALRLLRQAFDRRRFLLRPVAERARLDPARRLQGIPPPGPPASWPLPPPDPVRDWEAVQAAAGALARARAGADADLVPVAARVSALDPADTAVSAAADALVRAATPESRGAALDAAQRALHALVARRLAPAAATTAAPVAGGVADALRRRRSR